jgi:predicted protein tyrosine phosphatase
MDTITEEISMNTRYKHLMGRHNQLANVHNKYQQPHKYKRVLFLCSAGLLRSATAAHIFSGEPYNWNTRTAGVNVEYALNPVTEALLEWAEKVYCMEPEHLRTLEYIFEDILEGLITYKGNDFIKVLNIDDIYAYRDPELIKLLQTKLPPITQGE